MYTFQFVHEQILANILSFSWSEIGKGSNSW